ncbi:MAG: hypothetical protein A3J42_01665 [Candidatus Dadabacteria bacterium RIFCSPHIGHO2_12_FULL_53_21]|nr:MAG: hypothetical protein A3J42_01665 [Candidatus Dadabacteria bacterium RIFCSPHIGHO2_12_FULL_53_21]
MKPVRAIYKSKISKFLIPLLGVLFVFSVSVHSHRISFCPDSLVKISGTSQEAGHSVEGCSACLLHGSIKLASASAVFSPMDPGQSISYKETIYLTPHSFLLQNKLSRSPPAI